MQPYTKKVQYYETDMMGIAHHANYIRWMEEARIDFLDRMGFPYRASYRRCGRCPASTKGPVPSGIR